MQVKIIRCVATNDRGLRVGEYHPNAKLTDKEVEEVRDLHEFAAWGYEDIAVAYKQSKWAIARICRYERRNQTYEHWKKIEVMVDAHDKPIMADG